MTSIPYFYESSAAEVAFLPTLPTNDTPILAGDYLLERWLPLLGPDKYALVCVLRSLCYQNPATDELVTEFSLDLADLAAKIGKSRATVCRLLQRNAQGKIIEEQKDGPPVPSLLNHFVQVLPQQRYSRPHGRKVQAVNRFKVAWTIPPVPGEEASHPSCSSESQNETLKAPQFMPAAYQTKPAAAYACTCPYVQVEMHLENLKMRQQSIVSSLVSEEIPSNERYRTIRERQPGSINSLRKSTPTSSPEKALGGGEASGVSTGQHLSRARQKAPSRPLSRLPKQLEQESPTGFALALAKAERAAGGVLVDLLKHYGDPNPTVGMRTVLVALVEASAPFERLGDLGYLGRNRLRRFQLRGGHIQTTVPGYFINLMRNLASEARGKGWDTARMEREDQLKHEEILRRLAARGKAKPRVGRGAAETEPEAADEEAATEAAPEELVDACEEEAASTASASAYEGHPSSIALEPASFLPEGVAVAEAAVVATWRDHMPDPQGGQPRAVSMLWGFVCEALQPQMNLPLQRQLDALTPKWDATRPRTLLLLCSTAYAARAAELQLRRDIESQLSKLLSRFFNQLQVVYVPKPEESA